MDISILLGKTLTAVINDGDEVIFKVNDGSEYKLWHSQDCCEGVRVEEVIGDLDDLVGSPVIEAEEVESPQGDPAPEHPDSWTWTFYKLGTAKGFVNLRWLGESNGYYSESVDFCQTKEGQ